MLQTNYQPSHCPTPQPVRPISQQTAVSGFARRINHRGSSPMKAQAGLESYIMAASQLPTTTQGSPTHNASALPLTKSAILGVAKNHQRAKSSQFNRRPMRTPPLEYLGSEAASHFYNQPTNLQIPAPQFSQTTTNKKPRRLVPKINVAKNPTQVHLD